MVKIKLRPHHVLGYIEHEIAWENGGSIFDLADKKYIALFRQKKGNFHSDDLILHWRDTLKQLHKNLDLKFEYVDSIDDSVCDKCEYKDNCGNPNHEYYKIVLQADKGAIQLLPELEFGEIYNGQFIRRFIPRIKS